MVPPDARRRPLRPRARPGACLFDLVLAGSHDSAAYSIDATVASRAAIAPLRMSRAVRWGSGSILRDFSATQTLTVAEQLRAGVRFLDIRVTKLAAHFRDDRFWTCHGQALCVPLEDVLAEVNAFHDELAAAPGPAGSHDVPVVSVWRTFMLSDDEQRELGEYVGRTLRGGCFGGAAEDLRVTPVAHLPRNIAAGLPEVNDLLPDAFGHDAWISTLSPCRKIRFLCDLLRKTKARTMRDDLCVVGFTVTAHTVDVVLRIVSVGVFRPALKTEALKMNAILPSFLCANDAALACVANCIFADFLTPEMVERIVDLNALVAGGHDTSEESSTDGWTG
jgi:hypothetical protein